MDEHDLIRDLFAQNLVFLRAVPLIARPNVHFNILCGIKETMTCNELIIIIIWLCALPYLPSSMVYKKTGIVHILK